MLPNRIINWFKDLPSVPKLVIVGLALLLLLTILSPVVRVVAIVVFVVSAIVLAVRAIQRKPLRGWIIAVIGSLVLIPIFGGISGAIYGNDFRDSGGSDGSGEIAGSAGDDQFLDSLSEAEVEYIEQTISIANETASLVNRQIELNDQCGGSCFVSETAMQETKNNVERMNESVANASQITPPQGYENSYEAFLNSWNKRYELMNYLQMGTLQGDTYLNSLMLDGNNYQSQAIELVPSDAQGMYQPLY